MKQTQKLAVSTDFNKLNKKAQSQIKGGGGGTPGTTPPDVKTLD